MQRLSYFAALVLLSTVVGSAQAEDQRPSALSCDVTKLGARELADCLRTASDKTDKALYDTVTAAIKSIETRAGLLSGQKGRWKRALNEAESQWLTWRDLECQDVAPFEVGLGSKGGDPRLACLIDQSTRRIADLKGRYP
jgi:uncharacterized protein YecT (DUF1311 family)